jgi:hypothetical protein
MEHQKRGKEVMPSLQTRFYGNLVRKRCDVRRPAPYVLFCLLESRIRKEGFCCCWVGVENGENTAPITTLCRTSIPVDRSHCGMCASIMAVFGHGEVVERIRIFVFVYKGILLFAEGKDQADGACFVVKKTFFWRETSTAHSSSL